MKNRAIAFALALICAITLLTACGGEKPLTAAEILELGEKYLLELDYEQAVVYFEQLIALEPMNARGYLGAAEAYVALGRIDDAIAVLQRGLDELGENTDIAAMLNELNGIITAQTPNGAPHTDPADEIFTAEQLSFLESTAETLLDYDYATIFPVIATAEFVEICRSIDTEYNNFHWENDYDGWGLQYSSYEQPNGDVTEDCTLIRRRGSGNGFLYRAEVSLTNGEVNSFQMLHSVLTDNEWVYNPSGYVSATAVIEVTYEQAVENIGSFGITDVIVVNGKPFYLHLGV